MSAVTVDTGPSWDYLLETWRELTVPEGWRPELTVEGIHMTPPPGGSHNLIAGRVNRALLPAMPEGCELFQPQGVGIREVNAIYVPDFCVAPRDVIPRNADPVPAEHVSLAVEITSPGNAEHDRRKKKWAYAHGGIPRYLLIDEFDQEGPAVSLFTEPVQGVYSRTLRVPFGQPIRIGAPFDVELDTSMF
ncbi:Endonuclease, Uma2 family (restriction endonuclease fold) [Amycolatopsis arida]|uniref:Endonuclease, Uma2 family (Restriction endonuclease fold) n=1 Tax=Amycolatopsis arida TaxID=587909 RepID=A0A1I5KJL7_9PSEU|nr:Uma2 family endonuclease [Amycolatopsis arida]TDX97079.1 Uma2 family endonuclease [Amycolatopsis arida]SFO85225.1 Endonuclease, Uma2 family (restriction endonuclease fold) [Amycolatopsis arida]